MSLIKKILANLPEVRGPLQKKVSFKEKLKWTLIILVAFFILGVIPLYGLGENALQGFSQLALILGASFGSIISLGIGPIVTASIVLQLLNGSGLLKFDTHSPEGRALFQGVQKLLAIFFIIFESVIFVFAGGLSPDASISPWILIGQLFLGGILILFMDEVISKWGFGSGISLFIAAGVSSELFVRAFSPLNQAGVFDITREGSPIGAVWSLFISLLAGNIDNAFFNFAAIAATLAVFVIAVYGQAMKVEIPLSFGRIRGHGIRWPLNFIYTSNIPVILIVALIANVQLVARFLQNKVGESSGFLSFVSKNVVGQFVGQNTPQGGLVYWLSPPNIVQSLYSSIKTSIFDPIIIAQAGAYIAFFVFGAILFSVFWVQTAGMDARSQANQILSSGLQVPGFRRDPRIIEQILSRYILPLTVMGGAFIGFLAASADLLGALSSGTGILLTVMIIYRLYEEIAKQHMIDMHPALRKMIEH